MIDERRGNEEGQKAEPQKPHLFTSYLLSDLLFEIKSSDLCGFSRVNELHFSKVTQTGGNAIDSFAG